MQQVPKQAHGVICLCCTVTSDDVLENLGDCGDAVLLEPHPGEHFSKYTVTSALPSHRPGRILQAEGQPPTCFVSRDTLAITAIGSTVPTLSCWAIEQLQMPRSEKLQLRDSLGTIVSSD
jgi:hypothetical protein